MATADTATDGSVENDNYIMNDSGCCVFVPTPESPIEERDIVCGEVCVSVPTNDCGLEHPEGSGTLAGCKSTTLPHFGVVINKRNGICRQFGYYTSGNTEEYEDECGVIVGLTFYTFNFPMLTIVFIKFFGMTVAVDNLANNFIDSLTLVGQYAINKNIILIFTIVGAIMGALGSTIVLNALFSRHLRMTSSSGEIIPYY